MLHGKMPDMCMRYEIVNFQRSEYGRLSLVCKYQDRLFFVDTIHNPRGGGGTLFFQHT